MLYKNSQNDSEEKSNQVALMHRIYCAADAAAIWLGQHGEDKSPLGMDVLSWISMPPVMGSEEQSLQDISALNSRLAEHPHPKALHLGQLHDPLWQALLSTLALPSEDVPGNDAWAEMLLRVWRQ
jgi:hypothetical protein